MQRVVIINMVMDQAQSFKETQHNDDTSQAITRGTQANATGSAAALLDRILLDYVGAWERRAGEAVST